MADYYSIIARALSDASDKTDEARRMLYARARAALQDTLRGHDAAKLVSEQSALEAAIRKVETETLFSEMRREREEYASLSTQKRLALAAKEFVHAARDSLNDHVTTLRDRLRWSRSKMVPTQPASAAGLARGLAVVQRMQLKAKKVGRHIFLKR